MRPTYSWASARRPALAAALGPHVGQRLLGVGQDERPAVGVEDLDPVHQHELAVLGLLQGLRMTVPLRSQGVETRLVGDMDGGQRRPRPTTGVRPVSGQQVEELGHRGHGVGGGQEVGPQVAAGAGGGEVDPAAAGHLHQVGGRQLRPGDGGTRWPAAIRSASRLTATGRASAGTRAGLGHQGDQRQQALLVA